jgi:hypothetical protein
VRWIHAKDRCREPRSGARDGNDQSVRPCWPSSNLRCAGSFHLRDQAWRKPALGCRNQTSVGGTDAPTRPLSPADDSARRTKRHPPNHPEENDRLPHRKNRQFRERELMRLGDSPGYRSAVAALFDRRPDRPQVHDRPGASRRLAVFRHRACAHRVPRRRVRRDQCSYAARGGHRPDRDLRYLRCRRRGPPRGFADHPGPHGGHQGGAAVCRLRPVHHRPGPAEAGDRRRAAARGPPVDPLRKPGTLPRGRTGPTGHRPGADLDRHPLAEPRPGTPSRAAGHSIGPRPHAAERPTRHRPTRRCRGHAGRSDPTRPVRPAASPGLRERPGRTGCGAFRTTRARGAEPARTAAAPAQLRPPARHDRDAPSHHARADCAQCARRPLQGPARPPVGVPAVGRLCAHARGTDRQAGAARCHRRPGPPRQHPPVLGPGHQVRLRLPELPRTLRPLRRPLHRGTRAAREAGPHDEHWPRHATAQRGMVAFVRVALHCAAVRASAAVEQPPGPGRPWEALPCDRRPRHQSCAADRPQPGARTGVHVARGTRDQCQARAGAAGASPLRAGIEPRARTGAGASESDDHAAAAERCGCRLRPRVGRARRHHLSHPFEPIAPLRDEPPAGARRVVPPCRHLEAEVPRREGALRPRVLVRVPAGGSCKGPHASIVRSAAELVVPVARRPGTADGPGRCSGVRIPRNDHLRRHQPRAHEPWRGPGSFADRGDLGERGTGNGALRSSRPG